MIDNVLHLFKERYYDLPQPVMRLLGSIYGAAPLGLRFGPAYRKHRQFLASFESWDDQQRLDFMFEKTRDVLMHAADRVPYYRRLFREHGFSVDQFHSLDDMSRVPMLTKAHVRQNFTELRAEGADAAMEVFTGGSTSEPMKYLQPLGTSRSKEKAYVNHIFEKTGYSYRDRTVLLKGRAVSNEKSSRYWQYEPVDNYLALSPNHLDVRYLRLMLDEVERFNPRFFFGFPSAILDFVRACDHLGIESIPGIRAVFLASENVFDEQIDSIRKFFRCDVLTEFGHGERAAIAYRINLEPYCFVGAYGLMRVVDREIVATTFDNAVMPLINYRLADFVSKDYGCYSGTDILKTAGDIEGRLQEFLVTNDDRLISICTMGAGHFSSLRGIDAIQYQQSDPGVATLVVSSSERTEVDLANIKRQLEKQSENAIEFSVEVVSEIPRSARGKRVMCVQGIDLDEIRSRVGSL